MQIKSPRADKSLLPMPRQGALQPLTWAQGGTQGVGWSFGEAPWTTCKLATVDCNFLLADGIWSTISIPRFMGDGGVTAVRSC